MKLLSFFKKNRMLQFSGILVGILETAAFLAMPFAFKVFIDKALMEKDLDLMNKALLGYFTIVFIAVSLGVVKSVIFKLIDEKNIKEARLTLMKSVRSSRLSKFDSYKTGSLISYFLNDSRYMLESLSSVIGSTIENLLRITAGVIILGIIDFKILCVVLMFLPLYLLDVIVFNKPIKESSSEVQRQNAVITEKIQEHLMGSKEIVLNNKQQWEQNRFKEIFDRYIRTSVKSVFWGQMSFSVGFLIYWFVLILIYFFSGKAIISGTMTIGTMILYANYVDNIYMPCKLLVQQNINIQRCKAAGERYFKLKQELEEESVHKLGEKIIKEFNHSIEFKDVSFSYGNEEILKGVNLEIKKGETVFIVGESGSGKSTLLKLLLNLYKPTEGEILMDGTELCELNKHDFYERVSVFFQDVFLFDGSLKENLTFSNERAEKSWIEQCINKANISELIEVHVEEQGKNLSGGQKQRVAVARTLIKDTEIFIFDEPTSSLDAQNKQVVFDTIRELRDRNKTVIVITHDDFEKDLAHRVISIENGIVKAKLALL